MLAHCCTAEVYSLNCYLLYTVLHTGSALNSSSALCDQLFAHTLHMLATKPNRSHALEQGAYMSVIKSALIHVAELSVQYDTRQTLAHE